MNDGHSPLGLKLDELMAVVRTCEAIEIDHCTPHYLQDFIVTRLSETSPALSGMVRQWDESQMHALCEYIKATYTLIR